MRQSKREPNIPFPEQLSSRQLTSEWQQWTNVNTDPLMFGHTSSKVANNHEGVNPYLVAAYSLTLFMTHGHVMRSDILISISLCKQIKTQNYL